MGAVKCRNYQIYLFKTKLSYHGEYLFTLNKGAHAWRGFWHDDASVLKEARDPHTSHHNLAG